MKDILADIKPLLPEDWEEKAKACKALQRKRNIQEPGELLSVNLVYAGVGGSYQATSEITTLSGIALDKTATYRRILAAGIGYNIWRKAYAEKSGAMDPSPVALPSRYQFASQVAATGFAAFKPSRRYWASSTLKR